MKIFSKSLSGARDACQGAALLMAFLVLIVIIAIVYQINTVTLTDERITYNEITRAQMDLAIESVLLQTYEDLAEDARAAQASEGRIPPRRVVTPGPPRSLASRRGTPTRSTRAWTAGTRRSPRASVTSSCASSSATRTASTTS